MPNRLICTVYEEMRICIKTLNFALLPSLIEEAQVLANRMEAKLYTISDFEHLESQVRELKKERKELQKKKELEA